MNWKTIGKSKFMHYEVSETGIIRSVKNGVYKTLKPYLHHKGYLKISTKAIYGKYIHRYVAEAFIPKVEGKLHVNHIDGNKLNNHYSNLEWVTVDENNLHSRNIGISTASKPCFAYDKLGEFIGEFSGHKEACRHLKGTKYVLIDKCDIDKITVSDALNIKFKGRKKGYKIIRVAPYPISTRRKLNKLQVDEIREMGKNKSGYAEIAKIFGVHESTIGQIVREEKYNKF